MHDVWDALSAYLVACIVMLAANLDTTLAWGGLVLLCVRLIADVPRAVREISKFMRWARRVR